MTKISKPGLVLAFDDYDISENFEDVEFGALSQGDKKLHFILNGSSDERCFKLKIKSAQGKYVDLLSDFVYENKTEISMPPYGVKILYKTSEMKYAN